MKTKSKLGNDVKSLVLAKAQIFTKHTNIEESSSEDEQNRTVHLRKATDADKEKKREKKRKKKQLIREAREKSVKKDEGEAKKEALNYLNLWNSSRETWCFKKKQQFWLLKNAFDENKVSETDFQVLLEYIIGLNGLAKSRLVEECEKLIKLHEEKPKESISDVDVLIFERASSMLKILF